MAEHWWRELGTEGTLLLIDDSLDPLGPLGQHFRAATEELQRRTGNLGRLNRGEAVLMKEFNMVAIRTMLKDASNKLALYTDLHNRTLRVLSMYGQTIGALTDGPLWRTHLAAGPQDPNQLWQWWAMRRAHAINTPYQASQSLRAVAAYNLATVDAYFVALRYPPDSASWAAWMRAAENLAVRADAAAQAASQSQSAMCSAVYAQAGAASTILLQY